MTTDPFFPKYYNSTRGIQEGLARRADNCIDYGKVT